MPSPFVELELGGRTVKVTNPEKVYFPARGETKLDLVNYFVAVGDGIVDMGGRPTWHRWIRLQASPRRNEPDRLVAARFDRAATATSRGP